MDFSSYLDRIRTQSEALLAAARAAGPGAEVSTCPPWTVHELVAHAAGAQAWATDATGTPADSHPPAFREQPAEWEALLDWARQRPTELTERLRDIGPDAECWTFRSAPSRSGTWARRAAHETAIHRLDAEFARAGGVAPDAVPTLLFDPEFAADGIDEFLGVIMPTAVRHRDPIAVSGTVLLHAADAGHAWLVTLEPGESPVVQPSAEIEADATIAGTADAVYRAIWCRPSTAVVTGDATLLDPLSAP